MNDQSVTKKVTAVKNDPAIIAGSKVATGTKTNWPVVISTILLGLASLITSILYNSKDGIELQKIRAENEGKKIDLELAQVTQSAGPIYLEQPFNHGIRNAGFVRPTGKGQQGQQGCYRGTEIDWERLALLTKRFEPDDLGRGVCMDLSPPRGATFLMMFSKTPEEISGDFFVQERGGGKSCDTSNVQDNCRKFFSEHFGEDLEMTNGGQRLFIQPNKGGM